MWKLLKNRRERGESGLARVLGTLAGTTGAWKQSRRGSFLVLVVGTLALLSLFAILYVTIGNQDLRAEAALIRRVQLDDVPKQAAEHISNRIIGADVLSRWYDTDLFQLNGRPLGTREATDYPSISWTQRSDQLTVTGFFDPVGNFDAPAEYANQLTGNYSPQWLPTDPWLASSEPRFLDYTGAGPTPGGAYLDEMDWPMISNVAPDGYFVNLANLRNNFGAEAGVGADANGLPRLSANLSLFDAAGNPTTTTDFGFNAASAAARQTPAFWTARQRGAFRPMGFNPGGLPVSDPRHPLNQWTDADGDGMRDSRWCQLTDSRIPAGGDPNDGPLSFIETDGSVRYFFAVRIVDLSALVNVNTATDFLAAPSRLGPAGVTPADIDLRRLLMGQDLFDMYDGGVPTAPVGYNGIYNRGAPGTPTAAPDDYAGYALVAAFDAGDFGYQSLRITLAGGTVPPRVSPDNSLDFRGLGIPDYATGHGLGDITVDTEYGLWQSWNTVRALTPAPPPDPQNPYFTPPRRRAEHFTTMVMSAGEHTVSTVGSPSVGIPSEYRTNGRFGIGDLSELLAYRAVNNPDVLSPLELVLDGRDNTVITGAGYTTRHGVLRSNRTHELELARFDVTRTMVHFASDVRQRLTTLSGGRPIRNYRGANPDFMTNQDLKIDALATLRSADGLRGAALFRGYADALSPITDQSAWSLTGPGAELRTMFYGYRGPELALHASAHLAVNMIDSYDQGSVGSSYTLLLSEPYRNYLDTTDAGLPPDQQLFPSWHAGRKLDRGVNTLDPGSNPNNVLAPVVNVHGVEAQPFITNVSTFTVYIDALQPGGGGDDEPDDEEITINGDITEANKDLLYRVVAFQIANPFNETITLTGEVFQNARFHSVTNPAYPPIDRDDNFYYVEFGGRYFRLASLREETYISVAAANAANAANQPALGNDGRIGEYVDATPPQEPITLQPITIPAGKAVSCYTITQVPRRILKARMVANDPTIQGNPALENVPATIHKVIEHNLGGADPDVSGRIYWVPEMDITPGNEGRVKLPAPEGASPNYNIVPATTPVSVNLWRSVRIGDAADPASELFRQPATQPGLYWDNATSAQPITGDVYANFNIRANDRLMDRLRLPATANLDRKLPAGQNDIAGTDGGEPNDQEGFTVALWSSVRRASNPAHAPGAPEAPLGALPGWAIESKYNPAWNVIATDPLTPSSLSRGDFTGAYLGARPRLGTAAGWRNTVSSQSMGQNPFYRHPSRTTTPSVDDPTHRNAAIPGTWDYRTLYPEVVLSNAEFAVDDGIVSTIDTTLRPGDLLLPLGIGPVEVPLDPLGAPMSKPEYRYTTLGEAMAMALGYEGAAPPGHADVTQLYLPPVRGTATIPPLDRGNLRLDDFAPFIDSNTDGAYDPANDVRAGLEVPPAMAVLDQFRVSAIGAETLTSALPGTININTMPLPVARCLPMLSPPSNTDRAHGQPWWWNTGIPSNKSDIAATVLSYRDKVDTLLRPASAPAPFTSVTFADEDGGGTRIPPTSPPDQLNGRTLWTTIPALNEHPGFRTIGELLAVRLRDGSPAGPSLPFNMDFPGHDVAAGAGVNNSREGIDSVLYENGTMTDAIGNEYKEQLAVANGVLGTVTARSDYFAVWFVVHGYRRADVENLGASDPMAPSIARRFVMVVDRSKVIKKGDKPEIVLFKEVPM